MFRKTKLLILSAAMLLPTTAALANEPYIGVSGSLTLPGKSKSRGETTTAIAATTAFPAIPSGTALALETEYDNGYDMSIQGGYRMDNGFRVELQGFYNKNNVKAHRNLAVGGAVIDAVDSAVLTRGPALATNPRVGAVLSADGGTALCWRWHRLSKHEG
jgi:hypothetical protein